MISETSNNGSYHHEANIDGVRFHDSKPISTVNAFGGNGRIGFLSNEWQQSRFRVRLYRFMAESIPLISSVIWTWSRLAAAPGIFQYSRDGKPVDSESANKVLNNLFGKISRTNFGHVGTAADILHPFFHSLFLDGAIAGKMELKQDLSGIDRFRFFDLSRTELEFASSGEITAIVSTENGEVRHSGPDVFFYALDADLSRPYGHSILKTVPFVSYVEQQLVDDMRLSSHNAGYHRLHVKIKPPEKKEGEGEEAYITRANSYFDSTVSMIKEIKPEDNPVTWEDVAIDYIGPKNSSGVRSNSWYLTHRAMVEEICSGTNLAPFLLGYSYNATSNWAQFKYDLVMRQVRSVQNAAITFLDWVSNIELSLKGYGLTGHWEFDNNFSAFAGDRAEEKSKNAGRIIDLYKAGLINEELARNAAARLI